MVFLPDCIFLLIGDIAPIRSRCRPQSISVGTTLLDKVIIIRYQTQREDSKLEIPWTRLSPAVRGRVTRLVRRKLETPSDHTVMPNGGRTYETDSPPDQPATQRPRFPRGLPNIPRNGIMDKSASLELSAGKDLPLQFGRNEPQEDLMVSEGQNPG